MSISAVVISVGHTRKFALTSNAGTGYVWMVAELPAGAWLEGIEDSGGIVPGGSTTRTFLIYGAREGAGNLRFVLARPWEPLSVADERTYAVRVRSGSPIIPLYAVALQAAKASGDTNRMRELAALAEEQVGSAAEVGAALADVKAELSKQGWGTIHPLYAVTIQQAARSGDLAKMKAVAAQAESLAASSPDIAAALSSLKAEIAGGESPGHHIITPYGAAITQAIARGDVAGMQQVLSQSRAHIADLQAAMSALESEIAKHHGPAGPVTTLYGVTISQAAASGDVARMKAVAAQADALTDQSPEIKSALASLKAEIAKRQS